MPYGFNDDKSKFDLSDVASLLDSGDAETLRNLIAYKAGDVISGSCRAVGYVTNAGKSIRFTIPLSLPIASDVSVDIPDISYEEHCSWTVRQNGNYLYGDQYGNASFERMGAVTIGLSASPSGVNVDWTAGNAISGATNNAEVAIQFSYCFILS